MRKTASTNKVPVTVSGITPALQGDDWFLIDQSGDFYVDRPIIATIWVVGGGCDGTAGVWNGNQIESDGNPIPDTGMGESYSGAGGDGGYVFTISNVSIAKNQILTSAIAQRNDRTGTSLDTGSFVYKCNDFGCISREGGLSGSLPLPAEGEQWADQSTAILSTAGENGAETPYGYVGSSGGGGTVCNGLSNADNGFDGGKGAGNGMNHRSPGTDAVNYGCGGGGGAICGYIAEGQSGGLGKQGCIIVQYVVEQSTLIVQKHYKRVCNTHRTCDTDYYSSSSRYSCCSSGGFCGCGSGSSDGYNTGTIAVGTTTDSLQKQIDSLSEQSESAKEENNALTARLSELQAQKDGASAV